MKPCNQCGKCCIKYSEGGLSVTEEEIEAWAVFQPHIHDYVLDGKIWFAPGGSQALPICPWLEKEADSNRYGCQIYHDRPADCRHYPVSISQMLSDECEMIEPLDLKDPKLAQLKLDKMMSDSRPALAESTLRGIR